MDDVKIERLGHQGDGIFTAAGRDNFVPFTLPGEVVRTIRNGKRVTLEKIVSPSEQRVEPACEHFTDCGGCQMQHLADQPYVEWKYSVLQSALLKQGIDFEPDPVVTFDIANRRKATFLANRKDGELQFGFAQAGSHEIVNLKHCPVLVPELEGAIPIIREFAAMLPLGKQIIRIPVLATETGLDLGIEGLRPPAENLRQALVNKAIQCGLARISVDDEILVEPRKPLLSMGIAKVVPPPSSFVQANSNAEQVMADLVCTHLQKSKSVIDLYSGVGTFALRLAENSTVWALEENKPALLALDHAWRGTAGKLKQLKTEARNLERRPVSFQEMKKFDGLVFDPPRAGAELQSAQIAKSKITKISAVSCNPTTLARDLSILINGGYRLKRMVPIDQFRFTPHLEVVALLEK